MRALVATALMQRATVRDQRACVPKSASRLDQEDQDRTHQGGENEIPYNNESGATGGVQRRGLNFIGARFTYTRTLCHTMLEKDFKVLTKCVVTNLQPPCSGHS